MNESKFDLMEEVDTGEGEGADEVHEIQPKAEGALCRKCKLYPYPFVPPYVPDKVDVIAIGEAPGSEEVADKEPFVGQSGKLLNMVVEDVNGHSMDCVLKTNVVCCRPPKNRTPKPGEISACRPRLELELKRFPKATILVMGKTAIKWFDKDQELGSRGLWSEYKPTGAKLMPSWHPAYVLRKPSAAYQFIPDVDKAFRGHEAMSRFLKPPDVVIVKDIQQLRDMLSKCPENAYVAYDLETDNVIWYDRPAKKADQIIMLLLAWNDDYGVVIDDTFLYDVPGAAEVLQGFFSRPDLTFCTQNGKFDQLFLLSHLGIRARNDFDTMLAHYILNENTPHGLKMLGREEYGLFDYEKDLVQTHLTSRNDSYSKVPFKDLSQYGCWDVILTRALALTYEKQLKQEGLYDMPFKYIIMPASDMFIDVEMRGIQVDMPILERVGVAMDKELVDLRIEAGNMAWPDINLNSWQQVGKYLYDKEFLGLPLPMTKDGLRPSTSRTAINKWVGKVPFVDLVTYYRRIMKLKGSYIDNMIEFVDTKGRVHPSFWIHGTEVGRLSARNPAIQTIPRPGQKFIDTRGREGPLTDGATIRGSIGAREGHMLSHVDYSQAELRCAAVMSQEPFLMNAYRNNEDLHTKVAMAMYGESFRAQERQRCKMFNFSYLYGGNEFSFAKDAGLNINMAREFVRDYDKVMPRLAVYRVEQYNLMLTQGYVESLFKRRRRFTLITNANKDDVRKACVHAPVSGTASDLTLISAIRAAKEGIPVILLVHDSILADSPSNETEEVTRHIGQIMKETGEEFLPSIPWIVDEDTVTHWAEAPVL